MRRKGRDPKMYKGKFLPLYLFPCILSLKLFFLCVWLYGFTGNVEVLFCCQPIGSVDEAQYHSALQIIYKVESFFQMRQAERLITCLKH